MQTLKKFLSYTIVRFFFSGSTAASLYLLILYILADKFGVWYITASVIAFLFAFSVSFVLQKFWTFEDSRVALDSLGRQLASHFLLGILSLIVNTAFLYVLVEVFGLWYISGAFIAAGSIAVVNFFIYRLFIFESHKKSFVESGLKTILIATGAYPPDIGGPATYAHTLSQELPAYGSKPIIISFGSVRALPKGIRHVAYFFHLLIKGGEADLIFAQDPVSVGFPTLVAAYVLGKRYVLKIVGDYAWEQFQMQNGKRKAKSKNEKFITLEQFQLQRFDFMTELRRKVERFVACHADTIIVPSQYLKKIVCLWGVPRDKIQVLYNSFDITEMRMSKENEREKLNVQGIVILSAGRLVPWKGFSLLIEVVAELAKEIPDVKLYIAGDGPEREALKTQISKLKSQSFVFLLGKLSHEKLMEYIQVADIFVLNTGYEGFSHQLLEVMALGTPIITTDVGGNPELIENQKNGLLVSYNDKADLKKAIELLLVNRELRDRIVKNEKERVLAFSKKTMMDSLIKVLTS